MRKSYKTLLGGILLFGLITWTTASLHYDADDPDEYGFPFNFYRKVSGYNVVTKHGDSSIEFSALALLGDMAFAFTSSWLIFKLITRFNKKASDV